MQLEIEGGLLERLLERALKLGACFGEIRRISPRRIRVSADDRSAGVLLDLCRKYGLNCRIICRSGKPVLLERIRARWTLLLGMLLGIAICAFFLSRVWWADISFNGPNAQNGDTRALMDSLREEGFYPGMSASGIDAGLLQKKLMAGAGEYSFIGVRRQGVRLLVEASPEVPSPELYMREYARDLVAERDGVVLSVNAKSGTACVKPGDTVRAGQTLIRGEEDAFKDPETGEMITGGVSALGEVTARCWYEGSAEADLSEQVSVRTGRERTACRLRLLDFSLPVSKCETFESQDTETEILPLVGLYLPLEMERSTHYETAVQQKQLDADVLKRQLAALARAEALAKISRDGIETAELLSWEDCTQHGNTLRVRAVYEICTDIAATRDALPEEVY